MGPAAYATAGTTPVPTPFALAEGSPLPSAATASFTSSTKYLCQRVSFVSSGWKDVPTIFPLRMATITSGASAPSAPAAVESDSTKNAANLRRFADGASSPLSPASAPSPDTPSSFSAEACACSCAFMTLTALLQGRARTLQRTSTPGPTWKAERRAGYW